METETNRTHTIGRLLLAVGTAGFAVVFLLNLIGFFVLDEPAALFFSEHWFSQWLPEYAVWPIFMGIGAVLFVWRRRKPSPGAAR